MNKEIEIPEGYEARIEGNKVIIGLKESEDERIKKGLIQHLKELRNWKVGTEAPIKVATHYDAWIAYLERIKEQKPSYIDFISDWLRKHIKTYVNSEYNEFHKTVEYDGSINIEHLIEDLKKAIEQQFFAHENDFVSKPAEWNDSVAKEMFIKALERAVEQTKKGYELTDCDKHSWWEDFKAYSGIKPAEWSEEDESYLQTVIGEMEASKKEALKYEHKIYDAIILWLKSLPERFNLQPKQEWSEEEASDETKQGCDSIDISSSIEISRIETLKNIISYFRCERKSTQEEINTSFLPCLEDLLKDVALRAYSNGNLPVFLPSELLGYADRLQSLLLRPHWKPSEKQINMLGAIVEREKEKPLYGIDGYSPAAVLESLYNDLQKLL